MMPATPIPSRCSERFTKSSRLLLTLLLATAITGCGLGGLDQYAMTEEEKIGQIITNTLEDIEFQKIDSNPLLSNAYNNFLDNPADSHSITNLYDELIANDLGDHALTMLVSASGNTDDPAIHALAVQQFKRAGRFEEGIEFAEQSIANNIFDWKLLALEGSILDQIGKSDLAKDRYFRALELNPGNAKLYNNLALSFGLSDQFSQAENIIKQAVSLSPSSRTILNNLALITAARGKKDETKQTLSQLFDPPEAAYEYERITNLYENLGTQFAFRQLMGVDSKAPATFVKQDAGNSKPGGDANSSDPQVLQASNFITGATTNTGTSQVIDGVVWNVPGSSTISDETSSAPMMLGKPRTLVQRASSQTRSPAPNIKPISVANQGARKQAKKPYGVSINIGMDDFVGVSAEALAYKKQKSSKVTLGTGAAKQEKNSKAKKPTRKTPVVRAKKVTASARNSAVVARERIIASLLSDSDLR